MPGEPEETEFRARLRIASGVRKQPERRQRQCHSRRVLKRWHTYLLGLFSSLLDPKIVSRVSSHGRTVAKRGMQALRAKICGRNTAHVRLPTTLTRSQIHSITHTGETALNCGRMARPG